MVKVASCGFANRRKLALLRRRGWPRNVTFTLPKGPEDCRSVAAIFWASEILFLIILKAVVSDDPSSECPDYMG